VKTVFTNGCFDLLHIGHVRFLEACREMGDRLVVGLNCDASVRRLKGVGRPILPAESREEMLRALRYVDDVIVYFEDTPEPTIRRVRPDVLVKGFGYDATNIAGSDFVRSYGGNVVILPDLSLNLCSTTALIKHIKEMETQADYAAFCQATAGQ
jgi:rfaE bifunctional protein nucleotidyltransferase chain/domain